MTAFDLTAICSVCQTPADNCGDPGPCCPVCRATGGCTHAPTTHRPEESPDE